MPNSYPFLYPSNTVYYISAVYYFFWEMFYLAKQHSIFNFWESVIKIMYIYVEGQRKVLCNVDEIVIGLFYILCIFNEQIPIYRN